MFFRRSVRFLYPLILGMSLDLKPYGINYVLKPTKASLYGIRYENLSYGRYNKHASDGPEFHINGKTYFEQALLGEGTYGAAHSVEDAFGNQFAVKRIKGKLSTLKELDELMNEVIIQIILAEGSKGEPNGPYVPKIYNVSYDPVKKEGYILCEMMRNTLKNLIDVLGRSDNDIIIPDALEQIAHVLQFFGDKYQFNHRDLKCDNIMYKKIPSGQRKYVLIDFGFSCLTWEGLKIQGTSYFSPSATCFKRERDLAQLSYYILNYHREILSLSLKSWLQQVLVTDVGSHTCSLGNGCMIGAKKVIRSWANIYNYLNKPTVIPKFTNPKTFTRKVKRFIENQPFSTPVATIPEPPRVCSPGKVRDAAGHCVPAPVAAAPLVKACPPGFVLNPRTNRCKKQKTQKSKGKRVASLMAKPCPEGKERNPKTGRCVTKKVKKAAAAAAPAAAAPVASEEKTLSEFKEAAAAPKASEETTLSEFKEAAAAPKASAEKTLSEFKEAAAALPPPPPPLKEKPGKECPPGKILNPKTRRCVKETGRAGKQVVKNGKKMLANKNPTNHSR